MSSERVPLRTFVSPVFIIVHKYKNNVQLTEEKCHIQDVHLYLTLSTERVEENQKVLCVMVIHARLDDVRVRMWMVVSAYVCSDAQYAS